MYVIIIQLAYQVVCPFLVVKLLILLSANSFNVYLGNPICTPPHLWEVSPVSVAFQSSWVSVWWTMCLSHPCTIHCQILPCALFVSSRELVVLFFMSVVSQAPQHFGPCEVEASYDSCFQSFCHMKTITCHIVNGNFNVVFNHYEREN